MSDKADNAHNFDTVYKDAIRLAQMAIHHDTNHDHEAAIYYYNEATDVLNKCLEKFGETCVESKQSLENKVDEYSKRAQQLYRVLTDTGVNVSVNVNEDLSKLSRAEFLMNEALDLDEQQNYENAIQLYSQAIELCLEAREQTNDEKLKLKLTSLASDGLDRAENLKKRLEAQHSSKQLDNKTTNNTTNTPTTTTNITSTAVTTTALNSNTGGHIISGETSYTKEELLVLRRTSIINGREFVPFLSVDLGERFSYPIPFSDKDGLLVLSGKQKLNFVKYVRLDEICENPSVVLDVDCFHIKQTVVSDCSFVASLAVSALYQKRFNKKIITSIIYPQKRNGDPCYNPCGKYMIKLNLNGISRKVIIDDKLPIGRNGQLLCSYSSNRNEFWVSLLEKAYMKVMGGYDFPGSNSNIDLHALTAWIPERVSIHGYETQKDTTFKMLFNRHNSGDVLTTFATGEMSDEESDRTGLVATHAYAMLDIRNVNGKKLFLLKNPWSHMRWKGNYSDRDDNNWTSSMKTALNYDPQSAQNFDNGVFWIDIESLYRFFDVCYLNWNPKLFKYSYCTHDTWSAGVGPIKDLYSIADNPQYSLSVKSAQSSTWILLTRHITDRNDFANNHEYIALVIYKNNGEKVYMPFDPPPYIDGVRINSPHYLVKIMPTDAITRYTLVISQYEKSVTINYTLRAYSTCAFKLTRLGNPYKFKEMEKNGKWTAETAGGCHNNRETYHKNPVYQLIVSNNNDQENDVLIDLKGPKDYAIGIDVTAVSINNPNSSNYFKKADSGSFRSGFSILKLKSVPSGIYNIVPSTFDANQIGPFFLTVHSTTAIQLTKLR